MHPHFASDSQLSSEAAEAMGREDEAGLAAVVAIQVRPSDWLEWVCGCVLGPAPSMQTPPQL